MSRIKNILREVSNEERTDLLVGISAIIIAVFVSKSEIVTRFLTVYLLVLLTYFVAKLSIKIGVEK